VPRRNPIFTMSSFCSPSLDEIQNLQETKSDATHVVLVHSMSSDLLTPVSVWLKLKNKKGGKFLFESVERGENVGRYSIMGFDPTKVISTSDRDVLDEVEKELSARKLLNAVPFPFCGGMVGFLGYESVTFYEPKKLASLREKVDTFENIPTQCFLQVDRFIIFDHVLKCLNLAVVAPLEEIETQYASIERSLLELQELLKLPAMPEVREDLKEYSEQTLRANFKKKQFQKAVKKAKEHIKKGDIFQVVISQRLEVDLVNANAFDVYRQLRIFNPSPYMFFFDMETYQLVGSSPECLVKVNSDRIVETHPIAGTRPRGETQKEDDELAEELLNDQKEIAEHVMLVDLGRNDIGRVSKPGTVKLTKKMTIERYSKVMHIVSNVKGELRDDQTVFDAFRSVFPAGTVSGAPKIRAMQIIGDLEPCSRGPYAGAIGYFSYDGSLDTAIMIRTIFCENNTVTMQAGAGIVYDSKPQLEYEETLLKARAMFLSIDAAERALTERRADLAKVDLNPRFGRFGGMFVPETLIQPLQECARHFQEFWADPNARKELDSLLQTYVGRPTPMYYAKKLSKECGGCQIYLKREDLAHTGAHKINAAIAQALLCKRMGKYRIIAETGAGQHGVATATACALLGLECVVYMGKVDIERQKLNVYKMRMLGAEVRPVTTGSATLKDAVNEAMRDWVTNVDTTHYLIGSVVGPFPFPTMIREFQSVIGRESRAQMVSQAGRLPDVVVACVGGGSNAIGIFHEFVKHKDVRLIGVEAAGHGLNSGKHGASISGGTMGVLHGAMTYLLQDPHGQVTETHSISAGLDYPGVGPEHAYLADNGRAEYIGCTDKEAMEGMLYLSRVEGIIPALETAHAVYKGVQIAKTMRPDQSMVINISGRGDKDMFTVMDLFGEEAPSMDKLDSIFPEVADGGGKPLDTKI